MKKYTGWIIAAVVVFLAYNYFTGKYNSMVVKDEAVLTAWSQVENQFQRRADLIPNLVETVKWFAAQEKEVLVGVTEARASASKMNINLNDAQEFAAYQNAQTGLSSALSRLLVTMEKYPELKSNQNFLELQTQLEGTENRISVERMRFNEVVREYNTYIRVFPNTMLAGWFWFEKANLFEAVEGSDIAPEVDFATEE